MSLTPEQRVEEARRRTPRCTCMSLGLVEYWRHGCGCEYGKLASAEAARENRAEREQGDEKYDGQAT